MQQQDRNEQSSGAVELDESYFGGVRKGKRGRGAAGRVAVFNEVVRLDIKTDSLMPIIRRR